MTKEAIQFFNLIRNYAEPKYRYFVEPPVFDGSAKAYRLSFRMPDAQTDVPRQVLVFEDDFLEAALKNELSEKIRREIDDALAA